MEKAQYAIMRFAKYKGPEIGNIEAHNERTKEKYASNPDVDTSRSKYNFHLVKPPGKYRAESERQIAAAGCRTRKDSIRMIETLFTASPEFFKGKKRAEIRVFFEEVWGDRIFEKCGIRRDEGGDGGKTLEIRGKQRLSARDEGANYQQS